MCRTLERILFLVILASATRPAPVPTPPVARVMRAPPVPLPLLYPVIEPVGGNDGFIWVAFEVGDYTFGEHAWTVRGPHAWTRAAPALAFPQTFTLVGPGRPCVVTTSASSYLEGRWLGRHRVFEVARSVCAGDYVIAVAGIDGDARAHRTITDLHAEPTTTAWVERTLGVRLPDSGLSGPAAYLERLPGTDVDVIVALLAVPPPRNVGFEVLLRRRDRLLARLPDAMLRGHLSWGGWDYVMLEGGGSTTALALGGL